MYRIFTVIFMLLFKANSHASCLSPISGPVVLKVSKNLPNDPNSNKLEVLLNLFHLFLEEGDVLFNTYPEEMVYV